MNLGTVMSTANAKKSVIFEDIDKLSSVLDDEDTISGIEGESTEPDVGPVRLSDIELDYFNDLSDDEFASTMENVINERKHLLLENRVFENFLHSNEPHLLSGMPQAKIAIEELEEMHPLMPPGFDKFEEPISVKTIMFSDKGHRINISQRTDLVLRDVEEMQQQLDAFVQKANKAKFKYRAEIEESGIRCEEMREAQELFEQSIVIGAVDPITQRIPAEKFIWYMQEWLKSARLITEKLRLRNSSLKTQYNKLSQLLSQKVDLGESISEVDFEQLRIENRHMVSKIEKKNVHLVELKKINGRANLNLATHKSYLQKLVTTLNQIKTEINETVDMTQDHERDAGVAELECQEAEETYRSVKELIENYRVPDVLVYVRTKTKLVELHKKYKILNRRMNILKIIMNSFIKKMCKLTGKKKMNPIWFQQKDDGDELDLFDDELLNDQEYYKNLVNFQKEQATYEFDIYSVVNLKSKGSGDGSKVKPGGSGASSTKLIKK